MRQKNDEIVGRLTDYRKPEGDPLDIVVNLEYDKEFEEITFTSPNEKNFYLVVKVRQLKDFLGSI